ncbi:unnamed protein product [Symbiodinium natans]|uniref:Uncharacterized protein n=1 Tax=Symbiodinium natans TaxID=878477 RepID=A0A812IFA5_9DINO|nr:unnamed protein product [Symbiodinium natans]
MFFVPSSLPLENVLLCCIRLQSASGAILFRREKKEKDFEVVAADPETVEFKIRCRNGKTLHERSRFQKDRKWGYVYSGESAGAPLCMRS